jgi:hypothetical protein
LASVVPNDHSLPSYAPLPAGAPGVGVGAYVDPDRAVHSRRSVESFASGAAFVADDTELDQMPMTVAQYVKSVIMGLPWMFASYMGFVEFVTFSSHILLTHITTLLSNSLAKWDDLAAQILFFVVMIPILEVFFHFVVTIFVNFFRRFTTLTARGMNLSRHNRAARIVQGFLYFIITAQLLLSTILAIATLFLLRSPNVHIMLTIAGMILAILCAISPLLALFRIMISGWSSLFGRGPFLFPRSEWVAPFDMAGLLTDESLLHFMDSESSPLRIRSRLSERWTVLYTASIVSLIV